MKKFARLSSGYNCPILGYGTFQSKNASELKTAIKVAVQTGYRHIDTAYAYENEHIIGDTLQSLYKDNVVKRADMFLTTKLFSTHHRRERVPELLKSQLQMLKTEYVDLYLIHFPVALKPAPPGQILPFTKDGKLDVDTETLVEHTWSGMEDCVKLGLTRSIGVSNFNIGQIERLLKKGSIEPAMNQIESHPGFQNKKLVEFCLKNGIGVTAYSQFGSPGTIARTGQVLCDLKLLEDKTILSIGAKYGKNAAQVILRWQMQRGLFLIPKSTTPKRIAENFDVWDFELSEEDMKKISDMDLNKRYSWLDLPGMRDHPDYPHLEAGSC